MMLLLWVPGPNFEKQSIRANAKNANDSHIYACTSSAFPGIAKFLCKVGEAIYTSTSSACVSLLSTLGAVRFLICTHLIFNNF